MCIASEEGVWLPCTLRLKRRSSVFAYQHKDRKRLKQNDRTEQDVSFTITSWVTPIAEALSEKGDRILLFTHHS